MILEVNPSILISFSDIKSSGLSVITLAKVLTLSPITSINPNQRYYKNKSSQVEV